MKCRRNLLSNQWKLRFWEKQNGWLKDWRFDASQCKWLNPAVQTRECGTLWGACAVKSAERPPFPCKGNQSKRMLTIAIKSSYFTVIFFRHFDVVEGTRKRSKERWRFLPYSSGNLSVTYCADLLQRFPAWVDQRQLTPFIQKKKMINTLIANWRDGGTDCTGHFWSPQ